MFKKRSLLLVLALLVMIAMAMSGCGSDKPETPPADNGENQVEPALVLADDDYGDEFYGVGCRKGDVAFINELNRALNEIIEDGTAAQISQKWFGDDIVYVPEEAVDVPTPAADDKSWENIQAKGKFVMGLDDEFPPMGFVDEETGELVGFDIELAKAVAEKLGVEVTFQPIAWDSKELELTSGNIDVVWNGLTMSDERVNSDTWGFTQPYLQNKQVIIAWNTSNIKTKADLAGKKVASQLDSSGQYAVEAEPEVMATFDGDLITTDTYLTALMDLKAHNIDAIVGDEILVKYYMEKDAEKTQE